MGNNVLTASVFQQKAAGNDAQQGKAQLFVQAQGRSIGSDHRVELKDAEAQFLPLRHAVPHHLFADMTSAHAEADGIAGIADMPAPAHVVRMQDIQARKLSASGVAGYAREGLRGEELVPRCFRQKFRLREGAAFPFV